MSASGNCSVDQYFRGMMTVTSATFVTDGNSSFLLHFYRKQTKLWESNVLHVSVIHSVHRGEGCGEEGVVDIPPWTQRQTPLTPGPRGRHPSPLDPEVDTFPDRDDHWSILLECILVYSKNCGIPQTSKVKLWATKIKRFKTWNFDTLNWEFCIFIAAVVGVVRRGVTVAWHQVVVNLRISKPEHAACRHVTQFNLQNITCQFRIIELKLRCPSLRIDPSKSFLFLPLLFKKFSKLTSLACSDSSRLSLWILAVDWVSIDSRLPSILAPSGEGDGVDACNWSCRSRASSSFTSLVSSSSPGEQKYEFKFHGLFSC